MRLLLTTLALFVLPTSGQAQPMTDKELIVVAAPRTGDPYYADMADAIFDFHIGFAAQVRGRDDFLVLVDDGAHARYVAALGPDRVALAPMDDIWLRDFAPSHPVRPVLFRYTAAGQGGGLQGQRDADAVQDTLAVLMEDAGLDVAETDLLNDGGNFVDDGTGRTVVSTKFLADNDLDENNAWQAIRAATGVRHVAFIAADEQGGLEHADGVVAFIGRNTAIVNAYPEDPGYAADLRLALRQGLPGLTLHEIVTPYDGTEIYDDRFGSACGIYTNMLVTPDRIYLPQFGLPEDAEALDTVRRLTRKEVVPVQSEMVCHMGGGVRCMSWQLRGENARRLLEYFEDQG